MSGDDVASLQRALAQRHCYDGVVDGSFGWSTRQAVVAFQRSNALPADGVAGATTLEALGLNDAAGSNPVPGGKARSLHIGLNGVDPASYAGWSGKLGGCENDARAMLRIAQVEGYATKTLYTRDATSHAVLAAIADAATSVPPGGFFLMTYAGHGGQVPNGQGPTADSESDGRDETWALYDRMLIDDELSDAFSAFLPGVNIVLLSDSCHSGTVYRFAKSDGRRIPDHVLSNVLQQDGARYREIQQIAGRALVSARGLSLSGCQDNQSSQEVNGSGVFTSRVVSTWANRSFRGSYTLFHRRIVLQMPPTQTPQLSLFGVDAQSLAAATPFAPMETDTRTAAAGMRSAA